MCVTRQSIHGGGGELLLVTMQSLNPALVDKYITIKSCRHSSNTSGSPCMCFFRSSKEPDMQHREPYLQTQCEQVCSENEGIFAWGCPYLNFVVCQRPNRAKSLALEDSGLSKV